MANEINLPDIPGAKRMLQIQFRILDAGGAREEEGSVKLFTSRWAFTEPYLLAELIQHLGRDIKDFVNPGRARITFTWSILPLDHPLDSGDEKFLSWAKTIK